MAFTRKKREKSRKQGLKADTKLRVGEIKSALMFYILTKWLKILRTNYETANAEAVLDGNLDEFIDEELRKL